MSDAPEVGVVIPTKNRWSILSTTLEIVLGQEDVRLEVAVVDDGSTDETPDRLRSLDDPRVRVFRHEQSQGVAGARNRGLEETRAEWVAFLDDDDLWSPRKLRTQLDALSQSGALLCYGASVVLDEENALVTPDAPAPDPEALAALLLEGNVIPGGCSNVVTRADVARDVGGFDERLSMLADWDLWLRLADRGAAVACPEVLVAYRKHSRNMTIVDLGHMDRELDYFASKQRSARGMRFDHVQYSRWLAREAAGPIQAAGVYLRTGVAYRSPGNIALAVGELLGARVVKRAAISARSALSNAIGGRQDLPAPAAPAWLEPYR